MSWAPGAPTEPPTLLLTHGGLLPHMKPETPHHRWQRYVCMYVYTHLHLVYTVSQVGQPAGTASVEALRDLATHMGVCVPRLQNAAPTPGRPRGQRHHGLPSLCGRWSQGLRGVPELAGALTPSFLVATATTISNVPCPEDGAHASYPEDT